MDNLWLIVAMLCHLGSGFCPRRTAFRTPRVYFSSAQDQDFIRRQSESGGSSSPASSEAEHLNLQREVFDEMAETFRNGETIPDELIPVYNELADEIMNPLLLSRQTLVGEEGDESDAAGSPLKIMDVACGTGALFRFLAERANCTDSMDLTAIDLSSKMVAGARECAAQVLEEFPSVSIQVVESDFMQYASDEEFDAVIFNACFANFWNQTAVLEHAAQFLRPPTPARPEGGLLFLTHPLGADFVQQLHESSPQTVPHVLPDSIESLNTLTRFLPLRLDQLRTSSFYSAQLSRVRHRCRPRVMQFRGPVASGYGRGGKKLGFPTANLEPALFREALENVPPGVYFGWAVVESENHDDTIHKAVVNVGFSPTFAGSENAEKIVEAHLLLEGESSIPDFYGETMRLQLHGSLRPEIKFDSFPALVAQITADAAEARAALDLEPSQTLRRDAFLTMDLSTSASSWEFRDANSLIQNIQKEQ